MSTVLLVEVGAAAAQAAIRVATGSDGDSDAGALCVGLLEFLRVHAVEVAEGGEYPDLLDAYREWLEITVEMYSTGDESKVREYTRRGAILGAEIDLASRTVALR
ncbi:MAG: hypothetical protein ACRDTM_01385 [Micromonosporaceae bacterium]